MPIRTSGTTTWSTAASASPRRSSSTSSRPRGRSSARSRCPTAPSLESRTRPDGHQLLLEVRARAQPVDRRPVRHVHGLPRAGRRARRLQLEHARGHRPDRTRFRAPTTASSRRSTRTGQFHFTETNAYSGNNGRAADPQRERRQRPLHGGQRRQRRQPAAARGHRRCRRADPDSQSNRPRSRRPRAARRRSAASTSRSSATRSRQGRQGHNFRGLTIFDNVLYYTKGSGGNGVNTVYFVDTTGTACPNGVGLPVAGRAAADVADRLRPERSCRPGRRRRTTCASSRASRRR